MTKKIFIVALCVFMFVIVGCGHDNNSVSFGTADTTHRDTSEIEQSITKETSTDSQTEESSSSITEESQPSPTIPIVDEPITDVESFIKDFGAENFTSFEVIDISQEMRKDGSFSNLYCITAMVDGNGVIFYINTDTNEILWNKDYGKFCTNASSIVEEFLKPYVRDILSIQCKVLYWPDKKAHGQYNCVPVSISSIEEINNNHFYLYAVINCSVDTFDITSLPYNTLNNNCYWVINCQDKYDTDTTNCIVQVENGVAYINGFQYDCLENDDIILYYDQKYIDVDLQKALNPNVEKIIKQYNQSYKTADLMYKVNLKYNNTSNDITVNEHTEDIIRIAMVNSCGTTVIFDRAIGNVVIHIKNTCKYSHYLTNDLAADDRYEEIYPISKMEGFIMHTKEMRDLEFYFYDEK